MAKTDPSKMGPMRKKNKGNASSFKLKSLKLCCKSQGSPEPNNYVKKSPISQEYTLKLISQQIKFLSTYKGKPDFLQLCRNLYMKTFDRR